MGSTSGWFPAHASLPSSCLIAASRDSWDKSCAHALAAWIANLVGMIVPEKLVKAEEFSDMLLDGLALKEDQFKLLVQLPHGHGPSAVLWPCRFSSDQHEASSHQSPFLQIKAQESNEVERESGCRSCVYS